MSAFEVRVDKKEYPDDPADKMFHVELGVPKKSIGIYWQSA
jgi:hypothetical protein